MKECCAAESLFGIQRRRPRKGTGALLTNWGFTQLAPLFEAQVVTRADDACNRPGDEGVQLGLGPKIFGKVRVSPDGQAAKMYGTGCSDSIAI